MKLYRAQPTALDPMGRPTDFKIPRKEVPLRPDTRNDEQVEQRDQQDLYFISSLPSHHLAGDRQRPSDHVIGPQSSTHAFQSPSVSSRASQDSWIWEICGLGMSLVAIASICGVLVAYNGKPSPRLPHGITLNAVISFLATIAKGSLIMVIAATISQRKWLWYRQGSQQLKDAKYFEEASRGPLGAISLLLFHHGSIIASSCAVITVCSIAFEPFVQQLVVLPVKTTPSGSLSAFINATSNILPSDGSTPQNLYSSDAFFLPLDTVIRRGIYNGISSSLSQPLCETGDCVWPRYHSIALCSKCIDASHSTSQLKISKPISLIAAAEEFASKVFMNRTVTTPSATARNFVFEPNGAYTIPVTQEIDLFDNSVDINDEVVLWGSHTVKQIWSLNNDDPLGQTLGSDYWGAPHYRNMTVAEVRGPMTAFGYLSMDWDESGNPVIAEALECAVTLCVEEYEAILSNSRLLLTPLSTSYGSLYKMRYGWEWTAVANKTAFAFSDEFYDIFSLAAALYIAVLGNSTGDGNFHCTFPKGAETATCVYKVENDSETNLPSTSWTSKEMEVIEAANDFPRVLDNIAGSVNDLFRLHGDTQIAGQVLVPQTFVHVRWIWIALPLALVFMSSVTLLVTIYQTRRLGMVVWKSSPFPLLYCSPERTILRAESGPEYESDKVSHMDRDAEHVLIRLVRNGESSRWQLERSYVVPDKSK